MLSISLPETLEQDVKTLVQENYDGDWKAAQSGDAEAFRQLVEAQTEK